MGRQEEGMDGHQVPAQRRASEEEEGGDAVESGVKGRQIGDAHCVEFWRSSFRQVSTM